MQCVAGMVVPAFGGHGGRSRSVVLYVAAVLLLSACHFVPVRSAMPTSLGLRDADSLPSSSSASLSSSFPSSPSSSSTSSGSYCCSVDWDNVEVAATGGTLYGLMLVACVVSFVMLAVRYGRVYFNAANGIHLFMALHCIFRVVWFTFHALQPAESNFTYFLDRFGFSFFFTTYTLLIIFWAENYYLIFFESPNFLSYLRIFILALNIIGYALSVLTIVMKVTVLEDEGNYFSESPLAQAALSLVSIFVLCVGVRLYLRQKKSVWYEPARALEIRKVVVATAIFTVCFAVRVLVLLTTFTKLIWLPSMAYYLTDYWIPELIPSGTQIFILQSSRNQEAADDEFVARLWGAKSFFYDNPSTNTHGNRGAHRLLYSSVPSKSASITDTTSSSGSLSEETGSGFWTSGGSKKAKTASNSLL
ncbi:hypothetical protein Pelo_309 [Pelomyxa schiedti]|nr:hypothetical protein Pelo_309 [Pelomyxa schiedti]